MKASKRIGIVFAIALIAVVAISAVFLTAHYNEYHDDIGHAQHCAICQFVETVRKDLDGMGGLTSASLFDFSMFVFAVSIMVFALYVIIDKTQITLKTRLNN